MAPLKADDVLELVNDQLLPLYRQEKTRLDRIDLWYRWQHENPTVPRSATREHRYLLDLIKTPWLNLVVTNVAQVLYVDGYRSPDQPDNDGPWRIWNANDMDARQVALHRAALAYGQAFAVVLPGDTAPVIRGRSPRKMITVYQDDVSDDWPMYALDVDRAASGQPYSLRLYDNEDVYTLSADSSLANVTYLDTSNHGASVCPVVRYANMLDLDGRTDGEVEPFIPTAARINKTTFDRLLTQHYASWKVRTIAGMAAPDEDELANVGVTTPELDTAAAQRAAERRKKLQLRQDDILVAENSDTKFGTLDETPLDGFIAAHQSDIEALAAVSQTPAHNLTGQMVNLSAEALAAAEASLSRKVDERKRALGKSHDQTLRLGSLLAGDDTGAGDVMAHVTWADMESRSLSQAVDALGKAAQMLGVPPQALWARIPGVTRSDVDEWTEMAKANDSVSQLASILDAQAFLVPETPPRESGS